jgi:hypothetical protein
MHRIDNGTATSDGKFTEGDPQTGVPATIVSADILNALQEEIAAVIEQSGKPLDKADNTQLWQVIKGLLPSAATTTIAGKVELATVDEAVAGTDQERAVTPEGLSAAAASIANAAIASVIDYGADTSAGTLHLRIGAVLMQIGTGTLPNSGEHRSSIAVTFKYTMDATLYAGATALKEQIASGGFAPVITAADLSGSGMTVACDVNEASTDSSNNINSEIPFVYLAIGVVASATLVAAS